ncbi:MAG: U32 family peptidase [Eubacteriales bacterium]
MVIKMGMELLSPAGDMERLDMALTYGADAVYLAGNLFGMRSAVENFSREQLALAVEKCHAKSVKLYVTCNTMPRNDEVAQLPDWFKFLSESQVDAVILADMGVLALAKEHAPNLPLHISTQASIVNYQSARFYHELGASRVILARELSLEDIAEIRAKTPKELELEAFAHGSMCMAYSGRCLLSGFLTGRDANRGSCAQPCRYEYTLVEEKRQGESYPIIEEKGETYIMNSYDMCMIDHIKELEQAGISSLKIEGRAKSSYYAAVITNAYRHAIDAHAKGQPLSPVWRDEVEHISHRPYGTGFFFGQPSQCHESSGYLCDWQVVAVVESCNDDGVGTLSLRNKCTVGDEVELLTPHQEPLTFVISTLFEDGKEVEVVKNSQKCFDLPLPIVAQPLSILRRKIPKT